MKKIVKVMMTALLIGTMCILAGCSSKKTEEVTIDTAALAKELTEATVTSDTLTETASSMIASIYYLSVDQFAGGTAYMSSGATACEVAVIECKEASQTSDVEKLLSDRVQSQSDLYASYNAGEVAKLDDAVIKSTGKYVALVVSDDADKAIEVLKNYGF